MNLPIATPTPRPETIPEGAYRSYQLDGYYYIDRYEKSGWVNITKTILTEASDD
jgi:hypothetical protein